MIKVSNYRTLQKRKSQIALRIRFIVFICVITFYYSIHFYSNYVKTKPSGEFEYGRKLLSINPQSDLPIVDNPLSLEVKSTSYYYQLDAGNNESKSKDDSSYQLLHYQTLSTIENCTPPAINEFPSDGFTQSQRKSGWIAVHIIITSYCFWIFAVVCNDYFVPAIELICLKLNMKEDIVGASFMAAATSSPELFINVVGTFITKGDIGVGTIVGSAVFNVLAVPACCGLFAGQLISLDWWPISRDCLIYCGAVLGLLATLHDGKVMWYEAMILVLAYFIYLAVLYYNNTIAFGARKCLSKIQLGTKIRPFRKVTEITPLLSHVSRSNQVETFLSLKNQNILKPTFNNCEQLITIPNSFGAINVDEECNYADDPWHRANKGLLYFILKWPITFLLWTTMPDCRKRKSLKFLTFGISIIWIGGISYIVAFLITIIGDTFNIPDSVMGLTILAAGMSVPEAVSSIIVTIRGHGLMGISNSLGSNTFDILLCLGLPWFFKAYFAPATPNEYWVDLNSTGLTYSIISLLATLFGFYIAFAFNKFRLDWKIGLACTVMYIGFLIFAVLIELNTFFNVNLPICDH